MTQHATCPPAAEPPSDSPSCPTVLLAGLTALGPFALQSVAPALPAIAAALEVSKGSAQLLVSLSMWSLACGAMLYGPLADRYGRRPIMIGAMLFSAVGAFLAMVADGFALALIGRTLQAVGAGAGMVLSRAIARDLYDRDRATSVIAQITAMMVVAPMVAPTIGGALIGVFDWRAIFALTGVLALALALVSWLLLPETLKTPTARLDVRTAFRDYAVILRRPGFLAYSACAAMQLGSFFFFVGGAPYVMSEAYGLNEAAYGLLFLLVAGTYSLTNVFSPRIARAMGASRTIQLGFWVAIAGHALTLMIIWAGFDAAAVLIAGALGGSVGAGLATPHLLAGAVSAAPERAGSASSLLGVLQFSAGGVAAQFAAAAPSDTGLGVALGMLAFVCFGAGAFLALGGSREG